MCYNFKVVRKNQGKVGQKMIILGIDPGYGIVGWGVIEKKGYQFRPIAFGAIKTPPKIDIAERINMIYDEMNHIIETYHPDRILIEPSGVGKLSDIIRAVQILVQAKCF